MLTLPTMEDSVPVVVPEDEVGPGQQLVLGVVALEALAVSGEVVEDLGLRLGPQLPRSGGQVDEVIFLRFGGYDKLGGNVLQFSPRHCQYTSRC